MSYILSILLILAGSPLPGPQAPPPRPRDLNTLLEGVERTYGRMQDFSADFTQISQDSLNRRRSEAGHVYLKKQRMVRYEYRIPEEKLFVSDGSEVYFYFPADQQVQKWKVGDIADERMPLMFLLGRSNLMDEFSTFRELPRKPANEGDRVVTMVPKKKGDIAEIEIEVNPANNLIRRLVMIDTAGTRSEFSFSNIQVNTGLKTSLFKFEVPAGVDILEGFGQ